MSKFLRNVKSSLAYAGGAISVYTFVKTFEKDNTQESLERLAKSNLDKEEKTLELVSKLEENNKYMEKIGIKFQDYLESLQPVYSEKDKCWKIMNKLDDKLETVDTTILKTDLKYHKEEMSKAMLNSDAKLNDVNDIIAKAIESASKSKFWGDNSLTNFQNYLDTLTTAQLGALAHILLCLGMLFSVFTLVTVIYGDWLIKYFTLETKYPRFARFIHLRRKFQMYSFTFNIILIVLALLTLIYLNFLIFIK